MFSHFESIGQRSAGPVQAVHDDDKDTRTTKLRGSALVVDDCRDGRIVTGRALRFMGLLVETAENGEVGCRRALVAIYDNRPFDLIIMDMHMPVMDGYAATAFLRSHGYGGRIAALTADTNNGVRERCRTAGCNDFANKPISFEILYDLAQRNLQSSGLHSESPPDGPAGDGIVAAMIS